jgi:ABC-type amino acid transport substrate-binding protein
MIPTGYRNGALDMEKMKLFDFAPVFIQIPRILTCLPKTEQEKLQNPKSYFVFSRTPEGEKLKTEVDEAFRKLIDNGKLKELSIKYFGSDISQ